MFEPSVPISGETVAEIVQLSDFDQARLVFRNWQGQLEQLSCGRFEGVLRIVCGRVVRVVEVEANQRVLIRGHDAAKHLAVYPVTTGNAMSLWQGRLLAPGQLVVNGADTEVDHCSALKTRDLGLSIDPVALNEASRILLGSAAQVVPHGWAVYDPTPEALLSFRNQLNHLLFIGSKVPSIWPTTEGHQLEQDCIRSLVELLFSASTRKPHSSLRARARVVDRAEDYLRSQLDGSVGVIDLCRELAISDRTLRLAFNERFGLGPMAYYKCLRLNAVRSRLKAGPRIEIAEVARRHGFYHLGNFAADYRRLFGEQPSATRRRPLLQ